MSTTTKSPSTLSKIIDCLPEIIMVGLFVLLSWKMIGAVTDEAWPEATFYGLALLGVSIERKLVGILDALSSIDSKTHRRY